MERLYGNRTNSDCDIDLGDPEQVADLLRKFEEEAMRDNDAAYSRRKPKGPNPYIKKVQLHFIFPRETRLKVAAAWQVLKPHKSVLKALSKKIAKEVIDAATKVEKSSNR